MLKMQIVNTVDTCHAFLIESFQSPCTVNYAKACLFFNFSQITPAHTHDIQTSQNVPFLKGQKTQLHVKREVQRYSEAVQRHSGALSYGILLMCSQ